MAKGLVNSITNEKVKLWYLENQEISSFLDIVAASIEGYSFDTKSGLFVKPVFKKINGKLKQTLVQVVFPRPTDIHYHEDVDEAVKVIQGYANVLVEDQKDIKTIIMGDEINIPKGKHHYFCPDKNRFLELFIACSGILDPSKEKCVQHFYDVDWYSDSE